MDGCIYLYLFYRTICNNQLEKEENKVLEKEEKKVKIGIISNKWVSLVVKAFIEFEKF